MFKLTRLLVCLFLFSSLFFNRGDTHQLTRHRNLNASCWADTFLAEIDSEDFDVIAVSGEAKVSASRPDGTEGGDDGYPDYGYPDRNKGDGYDDYELIKYNLELDVPRPEPNHEPQIVNGRTIAELPETIIEEKVLFWIPKPEEDSGSQGCNDYSSQGCNDGVNDDYDPGDRHGWDGLDDVPLEDEDDGPDWSEWENEYEGSSNCITGEARITRNTFLSVPNDSEPIHDTHFHEASSYYLPGGYDDGESVRDTYPND